MNYAAMRYLTEGGCPVEGAAWQVVAVIAWHADKTTGDAYISRRTIAIQARLSTGTVHAVLLDLVGRGILEIVVTGAGRRAMTYRVTVPCATSTSDSTTEPQPKPVVAQSTDRSGSVGQPVVAQLTSPSIGGREEQEGVEGRAGVAAPDGAAPRSEEPADAFGRDWRSALNLNGQRPPTHPTLPTPDGPVARPVSAAAAQAQQAAPDTAARPTRRTTRGRKGRRGREPPARCPRSLPQGRAVSPLRRPRQGDPVTPLDLADRLFGPDPDWSTPSVGDGPGPFDISNVGAWGLMLDFARQATRPEGADRV